MAQGPIVLIGFMGVGKTTVGKAIANEWACLFTDLDARIETTHGPIDTLFAMHGEAHFRKLEHQALQQALELNGGVMATGGGIVTHAESAQLLKSCPHVVWLQAPFHVVLARIQADKSVVRPLADDHIQHRFQERQALYQACATHTIHTHEKSVEEIAKKIINGYR